MTPDGRVLGPSPAVLVAAWMRRLTLEAFSYRGHLALEAVGGLVTLAGLSYLSRMVGGAGAAAVGPSGYFAFACVGLAAYLPARAAQAELARLTREMQLVGQLEPLAATPARLPAQLLAAAVHPSLAALGRTGLTLLSGAALFGLPLRLAGVPLLLLGLVLAAAASAGLGLASAAVVLHVRRSDPVAYLLDSAAWLGSGLVFPAALLPGWARGLAQWLPATHALRLARAALLPGPASPPVGAQQPGAELLALTGLAAAALAVGVSALALAVRAARRSGALGIP